MLLYHGLKVTVYNASQNVVLYCRWIGVSEENETLQDSLENFASQNYAYAREKLGDWVSQICQCLDHLSHAVYFFFMAA